MKDIRDDAQSLEDDKKIVNIENDDNFEKDKCCKGELCSNDDENGDIGQILDKDAIHAKIKKSKEAVKKDKSPQKKLWSFIFLVLNIVIVVAILLGMLEQDNYTPLSGISINYWWFLVAILAFVALVVIDQIRFHLLIKKSTGMNRPNLSYKVGALGKYYDFITAYASHTRRYDHGKAMV